MNNASVDRQRLNTLLKELHLPAFRESYEVLAGEAEHQSISYEGYLLSLVERECDGRRQRKVETAQGVPPSTIQEHGVL